MRNVDEVISGDSDTALEMTQTVCRFVAELVVLEHGPQLIEWHAWHDLAVEGVAFLVT